MKRHTAASILHPEALVQLFVQVYDIIQYICENKNTLKTAVGATPHRVYLKKIQRVYSNFLDLNV